MNIKATNILAKSIGAAGLAIVGYDTLTMSNRRAVRQTKVQTADQLTDMLVLNQRTTRPYPFLDKLKNSYFNILLDSKVVNGVRRAKNNVVGLFDEVIHNSVGLGLSALAVLTPVIKKAPVRNVAGKASAALLAIGGVKTLLVDVMGLGRKDDLYMLNEKQF